MGLVALASPSAPALAASDADEVFRDLAAEMLADIDWTLTPTERERPLRVAVWPRWTQAASIPEKLIDAYNDKLLIALLDRGANSYRFVARDALPAVLLRGRALGDPEGRLDEVLELLRRKNGADILILGKAQRSSRDGVVLSYRALDTRDGALLAATSHRRLRTTPPESMRGLVFDRAIGAAAAGLGRHAPDFEEVLLGGIRPEDASGDTPFGRYFEERVADALWSIGGAGRGRTAVAPVLSDAYLLKGRYRDLGDVFEVRLSLEDPQGIAALWRGRIAVETVPRRLRGLPPPVASRGAGERSVARLGDDYPAPSAPVVRGVQRDLQRLGYVPGPADGVLGARTRTAIRAYQRVSGLRVDGRITPDLVRNLDRDLASLAEAELGRPGTESHGYPPAPASSALPGVPDPVGAIDPGGHVCREFQRPVRVGGRNVEAYGTACREPDGSWRIVY